MSKKHKYEAILFDMDGTAMESDTLLYEIFMVLYDLYKNGQKRTKEEIYYFSGPPIRKTLAKEFPDQDIDFMVDEFHRIGYPLYDTCIHQFPLSEMVFKKLTEDNYILGIVTNKRHNLTIHALEILGLDKYFTIIVGGDDVTHNKPSGEGIELARKKLGVNKVLYVGDNIVDLEAANDAGCDCCLVDWGPRILPREPAPKYRMKKYDDLLEFVYE